MIALTQILFRAGTVSKVIDANRFKAETDASILRYTKQDLAVLIWNITKSCNLKCVHCYANASSFRDPLELSTAQMLDIIDDLVTMNLPVLILSGGEPLLHPQIYEISRYATDHGIRVTVSSNGTLITDAVAAKLADAGVKYVGISLDGWGEHNDVFRGVQGAFANAVKGLKAVKNQGMMSGIRFTITKYNYKDIDKVFALAKELEVDRFCVYHLVPAGRGKHVEDIDIHTRKNIVDALIDKAYDLHDTHTNMEILTVDNPADGVYALLKAYELNTSLAKNVYRLLKKRGGDNSGIKAANIDPLGFVHPNQFWWDLNMGNVKLRNFSDIWKDPVPVVAELRNKKTENLKGKCARCNFKDICGGFRLRALRYYGDMWDEDPDCYLSEKEIQFDIPEDWIDEF